MTRLFLSFYLFIAISLIGLSAILERLFFPPQPAQSSEQLMLTQWLQANATDANLLAMLQKAKFDVKQQAQNNIAWLPEQQNQLNQGELVTLYDDHQVHYYLPIKNQQLLQISLPNQQTPNQHWVWYSILFYLIFGLLLAIWLWPLWRDLSLVRKRLASFDGQEKIEPLGLAKSSFLAPVGDALEQLHQRVYELLHSQRELSGSVAHELRTPLSRIKFALALQPDDSRHKASMQQDLNELDRLIQEMLDFSSLQSRKPEINISEIPLLAMTEQVLERLRPHNKNAIDIQVNIDQILLLADGHFVERALENLILNGFRYAKQHMQINASNTSDQVVISVEDDGVGIAEAIQEKIFEPFYRPDQARDRQRGGAGMGLAIVRRIMDWHQGKCWAEQSTLRGAKFVLQFSNQGSQQAPR